MAYEYPPVEDEAQEPSVTAEKPPVAPAAPRRSTPQRQTMLDDVANDLALWIDQTATNVALAFAPGRAPFSAQLTEQQKLDYYKRQLFNPDGSPNHAGRQAQIQRLGTEGFSHVYKAVVDAYPELKPPEPAAAPDSIEALAPMPAGPPGAGGMGPLGPPSLEQLQQGG